MGRGRRQLAEPCCYHLTHRCQERRFFLRFELHNLPRLLNCLGFGERRDEFRRWYAGTMQEMVAGAYLARDRVWTEAAGVGTRDWLAGLAFGMRGAEIEAMPTGGLPSAGVLAESQGIYALRLSSREQRGFWAARQQAK